MVDITALNPDTPANFSRKGISTRQATSIVMAAQKLIAVLEKNNQSVKLSIGDWTIVLGSNPRDPREIPELIFDDCDACLEAIRSCRLYNFAKVFLRGKIRLGGSLKSLVDILYLINIENDRPQSLVERLSLFLFRRAKELVPAFARKFESDFHYSLSARAYELFLDPYLQYTCGRVLPTTRSVEEAQLEKFRLINEWAVEQLGTLENKRHLDIGCGWGGLILYFREFYKTDSLGLTNCVAQKQYVSDRFGIKTELGDFSAIENMKGQFDLVTVVGMSEHVVGGLKDKLLECIRRRLKDDGVLYFQTIAKPDQWIGGDAYRLAQEFVFPGHDLDSQGELEKRFAKAGFRINHAEDHALDYAFTTAEWAKSVSRNFSQLSSLVGLRNANLFLMYLLYASKLFGNGRGKLMRYSLVKHEG